jgi:peptidoglycan/xylan/chitin deacetylase (PgdA/CDA1 family)
MFKRVLPYLSVFLLFLIVANIFYLSNWIKQRQTTQPKVLNALTPNDIAEHAKPAPTSLPTPKPSPKPLTFVDLNNLYGPCANLPVLYYHHIQNLDVAKAAGQQNLTVSTPIFLDQMQYLKDHGYITVSTNTLTDFFDKGVAVPNNAVILTFDDGYEDFYVNVLPILRQDGFKALLALPTGLVGNPGYLTWDEIGQAASSGVEIVNHTWSHADLSGNSAATDEKEVMTADGQLSSHGYNLNKAFVYPYGGYNNSAINLLQSHGYTMAFTTVSGSTMCKQQRYALPRIRIGNASLAAYGF